MVDAFSMLTTVVVSLFLGYNLDKALETSPLFTITITFLGLSAIIVSV